MKIAIEIFSKEKKSKYVGLVDIKPNRFTSIQLKSSKDKELQCSIHLDVLANSALEFSCAISKPLSKPFLRFGPINFPVRLAPDCKLGINGRKYRNGRFTSWTCYICIKEEAK